MDTCFGQLGWKEFNQNRKDILSEFDKILEQNNNRPVKVAHGIGVEAYIRSWLSEFLPKKYGVSSGFIIPNSYEESAKIYHFDIIIFNQLDAPILWTEGNKDQNEQGKYRAIPAKYVMAIYEVKSRLTKQNISDAFVKLNQTKAFSAQLHPLYSCGVIFIDLKECDNNKESIIKELINGKDVYKFNGGMILRYEGDNSCTGLIRIFNLESSSGKDQKHLIPIAKPIDDVNIFMTEDGKLTIGEQGAGAQLVATSDTNWSVAKTYGVFYNEGIKSINVDWSRSNFSEFCVDLLGSLEGLAYNDKNRSVFGRVFDRIERKKASIQSPTQIPGKPFFVFRLYEGGELGEKLQIDYSTPEPSIKFFITLENIGDTTAVVSDDSFKNRVELDSGKTACKPISFRVQPKVNDMDMKKFLTEEGLTFQYRIVYYPINAEKEFYAIEKKFKVIANDISIL